MDETLWGMVDIVGAAILLLLLVWVVMRTRRGRGSHTNRATGTETDSSAQTEQATHNLYDEEEHRRREGTDGR